MSRRPVFVVIFVLDALNTREHIFRPLHTVSLESHHREDLPRPPSFAATVANSLGFRTWRKYHYVFCFSSPSVWLRSYRQRHRGCIGSTASALVARPYRTQKEGRRNVGIQLSKTLDGFIAEFSQPHADTLCIRAWYFIRWKNTLLYIRTFLSWFYGFSSKIFSKIFWSRLNPRSILSLTEVVDRSSSSDISSILIPKKRYL